MKHVLTITYEPEKNKLEIIEAPRDKFIVFGMLSMALAATGITLKPTAHSNIISGLRVD